MDIKKVESIAVPTALATVGGGVVGYMLPKMVRNGEMSNEFAVYCANTMKAKNDLMAKKADYLDTITFEPSKKEIDKLKTMNNMRSRILAAYKRASENGNKKLEKFVAAHATELEIVPAKGQTLKEAAKEYIKGKTISQIKEAFLPTKIRNINANTNYVTLMKESFDDVYDMAQKTFKKDAEADMVKMFRRVAREMKGFSALCYAFATGAVALTSSIIANRISNR